MSTSNIPRKLVIIGDSGVGKTSCWHVFYYKGFPGEYTATFFEPYVTEKIQLKDENVEVELQIWDSNGQVEYARIREASQYPNSQVVVICFAINNRPSLKNVEEYWMEEVKRCCDADIPILLVGCKTDLRGGDDDNNLNNSRPKSTQENELEEKKEVNNNRIITSEEGNAVAKRIGAYGYLECSAKSDIGVTRVFEEAAKAALTVDVLSSNKSSRKCSIM